MAITLKPGSNYPNWGDKRKIETRAGGDTKKHVSEVLRWNKCITYDEGYFEGDNIVIDK